MADVSDVMDLLASQATNFVYPNGTSAASVASTIIRVYPGWPASASLDKDLLAGNVNVSIYPSGPERNTTRFAPQQHVISIVKATITLTVGDGIVTVGGAMPSPFTLHNVAVLIAGQAFIYPVQANDTLTSIATGLSALIAAAYPGTSNAGPVIALPEGVSITVARVGTSGQIGVEWERQEQRMQITVWAPTPTLRNIVSGAIRQGFAKITNFTLADGFGANIKSAGSVLTDVLEKAKTYRRDMFYMVEYPTTILSEAATVVALKVTFEDMQGDVLAQRTY